MCYPTRKTHALVDKPKFNVVVDSLGETTLKKIGEPMKP